MEERKAIPEATVARLPLYLRGLVDASDEGAATISSERLAELAGVNAAKVRKDLSYFGSYGTRGVGYDVQNLLGQIRHELGLHHDWPCLIVGVGNLGSALAKYAGFADRGFTVAALVDVDPTKVGAVVSGLTVHHQDDLGRLAEELGICIGVIATPPAVAQDAADQLVAAGVRSILNFAPVVLNVPEDILVRRVDLGVELQILAFYQEHRDDGRVAG